MAAPLQIHERTEPPSYTSIRATPPDKQIQLPLTPPTTEERFSHGSERFAVASAFQILRQHQNHCSIDPWTLIPLKPTHYERFLEQLKQYPVLLSHVENKLRFDYDPISMLLSVRMPTPVHDFFTASVADEISKQLEGISHRGDSSAEYAARIANGGCARIFLKEDNPDGGTRVVHRREPDAQFQHRDAEYPGVVLEDYIQYSNGDIKVVIGIDIKYSNTKEATLSVWRPRYIREDGEELEILEAEARVTSQAFRAGDGSFDNLTNVLRLSLDDFATDELSSNRQFGDSTDVTIPYEKLAQFLNTAEEMQESREPSQGSRGHSAKSKRKTRKRKRTSSPLDQLGSADEAERQNQEAKAEERIDAADDDFSVGILVGVHDQAPRRSARQKLGGV
ncbi:hypothetical protein DL95DRAFT_418924 [Leptodontidium sp. 2 PMI_412]|nr:hypothetical protein DL95DRAFT_418924 [Leptodontidium sp. 2 PMI_412]